MSRSEPLPVASSEQDLVARARAGDPAAIEAVMRRHNRALYRTARAILRDDAEAEDVVQEAWLRAFAALATFRGDSSLGTWLTRIAANEALMRRRGRVRDARVVSIDPEDHPPMDEMPDSAAGPEASAVAGEVRALLE